MGRLLAVGGGDTECALAAGELDRTLSVDGVALEEWPVGTRLSIGETVVVELETAWDDGREGALARSGVCDAGTGVVVRARAVTGGTIRIGDAVGIEAVRIPLQAALDLHPFRPAEVLSVVGEYLEQAQAAGFHEVRIIHGRGRGVQRETVRRLVAESPAVLGFHDAPPERGGWGATLVRPRPAPGESRV